MVDADLYTGDCLEVLADFPANSVDACITDPPYGLDFMGKDWDHGVPGVRFWRAVKRVLKPGAMLMAFGGTRTHHRLMVAVEDAGFELRDTIADLHSGASQQSAFFDSLDEEQKKAYLDLHYPQPVMGRVWGGTIPHSHNISKAMDKAAGAEREVVGRRNPFIDGGKRKKYGAQNRYVYGEYPVKEMVDGTIPVTAPATPEAEHWSGWGTNLKPAWEPIIVAMKPRDGTFVNNALTWGVAGLWIDGGRIPTGGENPKPGGRIRSKRSRFESRNDDDYELINPPDSHPKGRWPANLILSHHPECVRRGVKRVRGTNISYDRGNIECRDKIAAPPTQRGQDPKNYCDPDGKETVEDWDCHPDCPVRMIAEQSGECSTGDVKPHKRNPKSPTVQFCSSEWVTGRHIGDTGTAARFFYCASPSQSERHAGVSDHNHHETVKPIEILRYLARLTRTPFGGTILDPFMGSGSVGCAAMLEGRPFVGIDKEPEYVEIARERIEHWAHEARNEKVIERVTVEETSSRKVTTERVVRQGELW